MIVSRGRNHPGEYDPGGPPSNERVDLLFEAAPDRTLSGWGTSRAGSPDDGGPPGSLLAVPERGRGPGPRPRHGPVGGGSRRAGLDGLLAGYHSRSRSR